MLEQPTADQINKHIAKLNRCFLHLHPGRGGCDLRVIAARDTPGGLEVQLMGSSESSINGGWTKANGRIDLL